MAEAKKYLPEFRVYRPLKTGLGAASKFQLSLKGNEAILFLESAKQIGFDDKENAKFSWRDKEGKNKENVTLKLGELDCGEILAVLTGDKDAVGTGKGLFHQNSLGNSALTFQRNEEGYNLRASSKQREKLVAVQHSISFAEGQILRVLLESALRRSYQW